MGLSPEDSETVLEANLGGCPGEIAGAPSSVFAQSMVRFRSASLLKGAGSPADTDANRVEPGGLTLAGRPSRFVVTAELIGLGGAVALAILLAGDSNWNLALMLTLLAFSVVSDLRAAETGGQIKISGSFLALVLAMVFLGGSAAALIGVVTIAVGWLRWRDAAQNFLINVVTYAWFPLIGGLAFGAMRDASGLDPNDGFFYLLVLSVFVMALAINFTMIASWTCHMERNPFFAHVRKSLLPVLSSELAAATMAVGIAYLYQRVGLAAIVLFGVVLLIFQHLLGQLLVSEERAEELERRTRQLASLQVGLLSALLHTLDLRDRMTARHSAAVARYSKEIAHAAGFSGEEQDLVHTAALLHDVGKFIFPDHILKGDSKLSEEDWKIIRMHPYQGARIVSQIEGYGPVGEIIIAHHERIDGEGYPRHLKDDEIPALARIISVADIYDVMTARDSYREPVSSFEAIRELRRVAGTQLDPQLVEVFVQVLAGKDVRYRHGEDADFGAELALEKRVHDYAALGLKGRRTSGDRGGQSGESASEPSESQEQESKQPSESPASAGNGPASASLSPVGEGAISGTGESPLAG
jgi:putative nucleotidyltransferase with HDIG domain